MQGDLKISGNGDHAVAAREESETTTAKTSCETKHKSSKQT
jgi:hypothetical protein